MPLRAIDASLFAAFRYAYSLIITLFTYAAFADTLR